MIKVLLFLIAILLLLNILIILQIFFCKMGNRRLGLILPIMSLGVSIILTITAPYWTIFSIGVALLIFILTNIPTAIFTGIFFYYFKQK